MAARGYNNYHGRRSTKRVVVVVLLVLALLVSGAYLVLQDYIVYDSQGNARLDLPFLHWMQSSDKAPATEGTTGGQPSVEILSPAEPEDTGEPLQVTEQPAYDLRTQETLAPDPGDNALVIELKDSDGTFFYQSDQAVKEAIQEQAVSRTKLAALLSEQRDWTAIAALCCFHDTPYAFSNMEGAGICQSTGYIWYDSNNSHWLDPAKEGARTYLYAVARECADMGFDQILLRDFTYPTEGKLYKIDQSAMTMSKEEALESFLEGLREALGEDTGVSVELTQEQVLAGHDTVSGVDLERIVPLVDHLFVTDVTDQGAVEEALKPLLPENVSLDQFLVLE